MHVIISTKVVWATTKDEDVAKKVRIASIMVRKSRVDMDTCCSGSSDVLGPAEPVGARGSRGAEDAGAVGNGAVTVGAMDGAIRGSSICIAGGGRSSAEWAPAG